MEGLIMDYELNVPAILRRGEQLFGDREIVTRLPTRAGTATPMQTSRLARPSRGRLAQRARPEDGDRVGTFAGTTTSTSRPTSASRWAGWSRTR